MGFEVVIPPILVLFLLIVTGFVVGKTHLLSDKASGDLTQILLKVAVPFNIINSMSREFETELLIDAAICFGASLVIFLLALLLGRVLAKVFSVDKKHRGSWEVAMAFSNTGFMGFPVAEALYGSRGVFLTAMMVMAFNILMYTVGAKVTLRDSEGTLKLSIPKLIITPINIATVIGLVLFIGQIKLPGFVQTVAADFGALVTPVSMFAIGLNIEKRNIRDAFLDKDCYSAALLRLVLVPLLILVCTKFIPFKEASIVPGVLTLIMAMPSPSATFMLAEQYHADTIFASRVIFITTLLSLITVPLLMLLV